ncbi:MAG: helix-turn-helix transcriptional regulator [Pseudomonadota bacterium]
MEQVLAGCVAPEVLLAAVEALVAGPRERPPFSGLLRFLEAQPGAVLAALYFPELVHHARPLWLSPSAERWTAAGGWQVWAELNELERPGDPVFALADPRCPEIGPRAAELLASRGLTDLVVANICRSDGVRARLLLGIAAAPPTDHRALLRALLPYLTPILDAFHYQQYLEARARLYDELAARVGIGEIHLNRRGEIVHTNLMADAVLAEGHLLRRDAGRPRCPDPESDRLLQAALERYLDPVAASLPPSAPIYLQSREPYDAIGVLVRQLPLWRAAPGPDTAVVALYLGDHVRQMTLSAELLQKLFDLSGAEARVAVQLARGRNVRQTAAALHVSTNTVRTHLARIFAKTGVQRQGELVALLVRTLSAVWLEPTAEPGTDPPA